MSDTDKGAPAPLSIIPAPTATPPAHARNMQADDTAGTDVTIKRSVLFDLIERVKVLTPCDRNPERFHTRKDELVADLFEIATA
ncbi:hypothetical protein DYI37_03830 [Fulvimarina endophytica]|uniref:Uncharacterized protein n=1 Tax=Fulvimarina endophytica TaxID=2293836 RepID=A0A371X6Z3_9HYPH|nr:hypothetical protein [Fulvimarina endophytica]RFC65005.1 hypothetical protein DYI37_03830 [Fulvimarina endophytica]